MSPVPFLDLAAAHRELREELEAAHRRVLDSGWFVRGAEGEAFEREFAAYCQAEHCVGVASGLDALRLGLAALGVEAGDEVVVPAHTFIATWLAVSQLGAVPVPVEPAPGGFNLDPHRLEEAIGARTRAVIPVHLYGEPADMEAIRGVAEKHDLAVLEDAAQAHGARHRGRRTGSLGHAAAFSFYPGKNLGALGDGGALVTDDPAVAERVRLLADYGAAGKYDHRVRGWNSRLDELQAAYLRAKLPRLDDWNARRAAIAELYGDELAGAGVELPRPAAGSEPVWHLFVIRHPRRDALRERLEAEGIGTGIHYPIPPHRSGAYADDGSPSLPLTETICHEVLSLPMGPHLQPEDARRTAALIRDFGA